jgi:4-alpha-glucanotransferase
MTRRRPHARCAGIAVPLFSIPSSTSWGIGEIGDIATMAGWLESAGQRLLQLLPINEAPPGERSPYSALSAMAIDPQFITLGQLEDFIAVGGEEGLERELRVRLDAVRIAPAVDYATVRALKHTALRRSFAYFRDTEWRGGTRRAASFRAYADEQAWWLDDYALFRALHARHRERPWHEWPEPLKRREPEALRTARAELADDVLYRQYLQWVAGEQWALARDRAGNVRLFGDLPFMVSADSADVWSRQDEFDLDASVGVPPDAFSETGQDWGFPAYRWDRVAARDFEWLRNRGRRQSDLFDGYRVDHLVGFYRTYVRPRLGEPHFVPQDEASQLQLGERILEMFRAYPAEIIAEDLGTVPDFVRASLRRLGIPGFKVFRWERYWDEPGQPFKDPTDYPAAGVATSGTHDTEPMVVWWEDASPEERAAVLALPTFRRMLSDEDRAAALTASSLSHPVHEALLEALYASSADILILPIQDVFGWRDRINEPATLDDGNWTWRLPWPSDRLDGEPQAMSVATQLREWSLRLRR